MLPVPTDGSVGFLLRLFLSVAGCFNAPPAFLGMMHMEPPASLRCFAATARRASLVIAAAKAVAS